MMLGRCDAVADSRNPPFAWFFFGTDRPLMGLATFPTREAAVPMVGRSDGSSVVTMF
jgi:hypothetical protein